jgi:hypothetical protein
MFLCRCRLSSSSRVSTRTFLRQRISSYFSVSRTITHPRRAVSTTTTSTFHLKLSDQRLQQQPIQQSKQHNFHTTSVTQGIPMTPFTEVDPETLPSKRRQAMELCLRIQIELEPHALTTVLNMWTSYFSQGTPSASDFRRFIRRLGHLLGHDTEIFNMLVEFLGGVESSSLREAFAVKSHPNYLFTADRPISDIPQLPESPSSRAYCNFMSSGLGHMLFDHGEKNGKAMRSALVTSQDWIQTDRVHSKPVFYANDTNTMQLIEFCNITLCGFVALRKTTPTTSFETIMEKLVENKWSDSAYLLSLQPMELLEKFTNDAIVMESTKNNLHVAPQYSKISEYEQTFDFMDYVLNKSTFPEKGTTIQETIQLPEFLEPTDMATMRNQLKAIIANDHIVFPNRISIGSQWADPGCHNIGDDTMVNALIDLRDMSNPIYYETPEQQDVVASLRLGRVTEHWNDRVIPKWDNELKKYVNKDEQHSSIENKLDEMELAQHNMLMKRALKLLSTQHYGIMLKRLASFLTMKRRPGEGGINKLYEELHFLFGIHFHVVKPLFDSLIPMISVTSLQDQAKLTREELGNNEPTLVALSKSNELNNQFHSFLRCHAQLNTNIIRSKQIKNASRFKTIPIDMWKRIRRTMLTDGNMSRQQFDDAVRYTLRNEKEERANMIMVAGSIPTTTNMYDMSHVDDEKEEEEEDFLDDIEDDKMNNKSSLEDRTIAVVNLPPYVTAKDIITALPSSENIKRIDIHGNNMKNTLKTIRNTTKSHFNKKKMSAERQKVMEVIDSSAFALVEYDTKENRNLARHRYLEYFGAKITTKFKHRVEKDPNNGELYTILIRSLGKKKRKIVLYDKKTKKVKRTNKGYLKTVVAKDKNGEAIYDPILPFELRARCRLMDVSNMRQLNVSGLQSGSSGYQIATLLSNILSPHCNMGPIADMSGEAGSISSRGRCTVYFPDHETAQRAYDAINGSNGDHTSNGEDSNNDRRMRASWVRPSRKPTEMEMEFRKRIYHAIKERSSNEKDMHTEGSSNEKDMHTEEGNDVAVEEAI